MPGRNHSTLRLIQSKRPPECEIELQLQGDAPASNLGEFDGIGMQ
jgi:hypothetical protein